MFQAKVVKNNMNEEGKQERVKCVGPWVWLVFTEKKLRLHQGRRHAQPQPS